MLKGSKVHINLQVLGCGSTDRMLFPHVSPVFFSIFFIFDVNECKPVSRLVTAAMKNGNSVKAR